MGVTIKNKRYSIDMGCGGFNRLRTKVAELTNEDIYLHYTKLDDNYSWLFFSADEKTRKEWFKEYDSKIQDISDKYQGKYDAILNFIYQPDCDGCLSPKECKVLWNVIKDHDDNIKYGYIGRKDCAMFKDFKEIVQDCAKTRTKLYWY